MLELPQVTRDTLRSERAASALLDRLRRSGDLIVGASEQEQVARYAASDSALQDEWVSMCRTLRDAYRNAGVMDQVDYVRYVRREEIK